MVSPMIGICSVVFIVFIGHLMLLNIFYTEGARPGTAAEPVLSQEAAM